MSKDRAERLAAQRLESTLKPLIETATAGVWEVQEYVTEDGMPGVTVVSKGGPVFDIADTGFVCEVHTDDYPEFLANARLFAASKEMYQALERLSKAANLEAGLAHTCASYESRLDDVHEAIAQAEAILAKARGESS